MSTTAVELEEHAAALAAVDGRRTLSQRIVDRAARAMRRGETRRSFLLKSAVVGSAVAVNPLQYMLRPGTAYASVCGPDAECADGWTVFCCSINGGQNACPPGTVTAGWWKADGSPFCGGGARYYLDCNAECHAGCGCGANGICGSGCHDWQCTCGTTECDHRRVACNAFRYGQCHQERACVGPVVCRVVSCVPPWQWDPSCTPAVATANATRLHHAPCLDRASDVDAFGAAADYGSPQSTTRPVVGMEGTPSGRGYWLVAADGGVFAYGDARFFGSTGAIVLNQPIVDLASQPDQRGYWLVAADGGIFSFGSARFHGSTGAIRLNQPIVGMAPTPSGNGYWLVARDGGVFCFGDARFEGSTGAIRLNQPIVGMAATPTDEGYWIVAADGGVFCFGDARFHGSLAADGGAPSVVDIDSTPFGDGYWLASGAESF